MLQLTGLWINKTKEGDSYLSGNLGNVRILVFKNKNKPEGSKAPDFNIVIAENNKQKQVNQKDPQTPFEQTMEDIPF